jgi:hypothetical protein
MPVTPEGITSEACPACRGGRRSPDVDRDGRGRAVQGATTSQDSSRSRRRGTPEARPLRALTIDELFAQPSPDYLIEQLLAERALGGLVGDSESLRSFWAIDLGLSIISAQPDLFGLQVVKHGTVLYIAPEAGGAFKFRVRGWAHEHDVDVTAVPFYTIKSPLNLLDPPSQQEVRAVVLHVQPGLIVAETLHRCLPGAEENSSKDVGAVVGFATQQAESGAAVLFLHHPPRLAGGHGSAGDGL